MRYITEFDFFDINRHLDIPQILSVEIVSSFLRKKNKEEYPIIFNLNTINNGALYSYTEKSQGIVSSDDSKITYISINTYSFYCVLEYFIYSIYPVYSSTYNKYNETSLMVSFKNINDFSELYNINDRYLIDYNGCFIFELDECLYKEKYFNLVGL